MYDVYSTYTGRKTAGEKREETIARWRCTGCLCCCLSCKCYYFRRPQRSGIGSVESAEKRARVLRTRRIKRSTGCWLYDESEKHVRSVINNIISEITRICHRTTNLLLENPS